MRLNVNEIEPLLHDIVQQEISLRNEYEMLQQDLSKRMNVSPATISRFERYDYIPSLLYLHTMANVLGKKLVIKLE